METSKEVIESDILDPICRAIYLEVPGSAIVLLQAFFESYEGVGIIRTLSVRKSLVCILTTESMFEDCCSVLHAIRHQVPWRGVPKPEEAERELYHGYFRKARNL